MKRDEAEKLFANNHPCIYKGQIICHNCPRYHETSPGSDDDCDMKEGRNKRMDAFCEGYLAALTGSERPDGPGKYLLTIPVDVDEYTCPENGEKVYTATTEDGAPIMAEEVTGTWRKYEI